MTVDAVIMAGGRSARMRHRGDPTHKALVPVGGIPLVERSFATLVGHGFQSIAIFVNGEEPDVIHFVRGRLGTVAGALGVTLHCIVETVPLGTIGGIGQIGSLPDALLVVNVDNISSLDLRHLMEHHQRSGAAMTIAAHQESFTVPFGQLTIADGAVHAYLEKPTHHIWVSSGTYVLSRDAAVSIEPNERLDVPQLYERLRARSLPIAAYVHDADWVDVNDVAALARAEVLIQRDGGLVREGARR